MKQTLVFITTLFVALNGMAAAITSMRCAGHPYHPNTAEEVQAITEWAVKCFPDVQYMLTDGNLEMVDVVTGSTAIGWPIFSFINNDSSRTPFDPPKDPSADCVADSSLKIVGFCRK